MTKTTYENEQLKRKFISHQRGARGFAENSLPRFAEAITQWQIFTDNDNFLNFDKSKAEDFCNWLRTRESKNKSGHLSFATQDNYLRRLKQFFIWLSTQPGYRTHGLKNEVDYLRLSKKDARIARSGTTRRMPTFEEVRKIIESIEVKNEIDMRDRALISFALITGCRISAIASLRMKNFDKEDGVVHQNPGDGVLTKNSKEILTTFFPIGWNEPERYFLEWFEYLEREGFQADDPLFPATLSIDGSFGYSRDKVGRAFWKRADGARKIFEKRCANAGAHYFNPHSFRHLIVNIISKMPITEEQKRAVSLGLGHANVVTTFGAYGHGSMNDRDAVKIVQKLKDSQSSPENGIALTGEERAVLESILARN